MKTTTTTLLLTLLTLLLVNCSDDSNSLSINSNKIEQETIVVKNMNKLTYVDSNTIYDDLCDSLKPSDTIFHIRSVIRNNWTDYTDSALFYITNDDFYDLDSSIYIFANKVVDVSFHEDIKKWRISYSLLIITIDKNEYDAYIDFINNYWSTNFENYNVDTHVNIKEEFYESDEH